MDKEFRRATILGCACVITSRLTVEELDNYRNFHPEALNLLDENDKVLFSVDLEDGPGHIEPNKAVYSRTKAPEDKATITVILDPSIDDKEEAIIEPFGKALMHLEDIEEQLVSKKDQLTEEIRKIKDLISQP